MKVFKVIMAALLLSLSAINGLAAVPEDVMLDKVLSLASGIGSYGSSFTEVRKAKNTPDKNCKGSFVYDQKAGSLVMTYTDPSDELFSVAGQEMKIVRDGKTHDFDTKKVPVAKKMSQSLLNLFCGKVKEAADAQNAEFTIQDKGNVYEVILTAKKKAVKGYSKTIVSYSKDNGHVVRMYLEEFNGNSSTYSL